MSDDYQMQRESVALEYGFALYRQYGEEQAAHIIKVDLSWMKRHRAAGHIPYVRLGPRKVRYFGYMLADILLKGSGCLDTPNESLKSETSGLVKEVEVRPGTDAGLKPDAQSVLRSARRTLSKQKSA